MGRAVSSLLVAVLLTCPLVCRTGHAARHDAGQTERGCGCCERHSASTSGHDHCPADRSPSGSGHSCQCICGGAVVDSAGVVQVDFDWHWSVPLAPVALEAAQIFDVAPQTFSMTPWPDVGMNHGRALCCLYNTFLC